MKTTLLFFVLICCGAIVRAQVRVGGIAPEIKLPNEQDSMIQLSSLRGKIVLVDFWASWCGPCRAANPRVMQLYNQYKAAGLEVLGVSIDTKKAAWLAAILQDKLTFPQVNDLAGWNSLVAEQYGVNQIPTSFLIDQSGKIIAIDLEGKQLENKIKGLLK